MEYRLKECLEKIIDNRGRNPEYFYKEKYPVIDNVLIKNNYYINDKFVNRYINEETYNVFLRGYVEKDMPIMTLVGSGIGNVGLIKNNQVAIVQNTIGFKTKEKLNSKYLYYWFLTKQQELQNFNRGSGQPSIKKTDVENMIIDLPSIEEQKKIVCILEKIDDKIELNNKINDNLFEILKQYIKENYYNNCNIKVKALNNIGRIQGGYAFKSKDLLDESTKNKIFKIKNISSNGIDIENTQCIYDEIADKIDKKFLLTQGNVIIAMTGAELGKTGYIYGNEHRYFLNQRVGVVRGNDIFNELYLNCIFLQDDMQNTLNSKGYGSAQPNISTTDIENIEIPIPEENELKDFYKVCNPIYNKLILNSEQNQCLIKLRDILLPKLMNGEIDLDKIEI